MWYCYSVVVRFQYLLFAGTCVGFAPTRLWPCCWVSPVEPGAVVHVELSVPRPQPAAGGLLFDDGGGLLFDDGGGHDGSLGLALQSTAGGLLFDDGGGHDGSLGLALQSTAGGLLFDDGGLDVVGPHDGSLGLALQSTAGGLLSSCAFPVAVNVPRIRIPAKITGAIIDITIYFCTILQ